MNDKQLIKGIIRNHNPSFRQLIEKYQKLIYSSAYRIVGNTSDAEDICQEVFLEVFKSIHKLRNEDDLAGWLFKIAKNKAFSLLRKRNPAKAHTAEDINCNFIHNKICNKIWERNTPEQKLEDEEAKHILFQAIDCLPESQKRVLLMHKFEDYSQKEICSSLDLSQASVESLIYRAKANLRKSLYSYFNSHLN